MSREKKAVRMFCSPCYRAGRSSGHVRGSESSGLEAAHLGVWGSHDFGWVDWVGFGGSGGRYGGCCTR